MGHDAPPPDELLDRIRHPRDGMTVTAKTAIVSIEDIADAKVQGVTLHRDGSHHTLELHDATWRIAQTEGGLSLEFASRDMSFLLAPIHRMSITTTGQGVMIQWDQSEDVPAPAREIDDTFARQLAAFIDEYRPALKALAR